MRDWRILAPLTLSTSWQIIPITLPARTIVLQCRTAVDVLLAHQSDGTDYWTLKAGTTLAIDMDGARFASAADSTNLITNGTFTGDADDWTFDVAVYTYNANTMLKDANGVGVLSQPISSFIPDRTYQVNVTVSGYADNGFTVAIGDGGESQTIASDASHRAYVIAGRTTTGLLEFTPAAANARYTLDAITVYRVDGLCILAKVAADTPTLEITALL
jgi:hypothetical protein